MWTRFALLKVATFLCVCSFSAAAVTVTVTNPANNTLTSPVAVSASATSRHPISAWRVYLDSVSVYSAGATKNIDTTVAMSPGTHSLIIRAWNSSGASGSSRRTITVQATATPVTVSISPGSATLQTGLTQQFNATVTGTTNTAVSWWVNGAQGGSSTYGTVSATGLYKAPASVPSSGTASVTAVSLAQSTKSASAAISLKAAPIAVNLSLSPLAPTVKTGATQQFTASVTGTTNTAVVWYVNGIQGGNTTVGIISTTGMYSAPPSVPVGTVTVSAISSYDRSASAGTTVSITPATTPVTVSTSPATATVETGTTKQFTASVTGNTNISVSWLVNGTAGGSAATGTISTGGLYTAPAKVPGGSITITAQSTYDTTKSASSIVTVTAGNVNQYYVSTIGNDSSNGLTSQTAWASINHANSSLQLGAGGTVVHVAAGSYNGSISTTKNGTAVASIRYISDLQYGAILIGSSGGSIWTANGSYTDIVGFDFDGSSYPGLSNGISTDNGSSAVGTNHVHILNNKIHDTAGKCNTTGNAVILLNADDGSSSSYTVSANVVDGNLLYHNNCGASGSTPLNNGQHGIYSQISGDIIRNNIIVDQGGGWCISSWHRMNNWTVVNNTMANCRNGAIVVDDDSSTGILPSNTTIVNNIVVNSGNSSTGNGGINLRMCGGTNNVVQNNLMYGNVPNNYVGSCSGATLGGTQTGSASATFVNYTGTGAGDYHSANGSAAIDHGTTSCAGGMSPCAPTVDFTGGARPQGSATDIGSYESGSSDPSWPWQ